MSLLNKTSSSKTREKYNDIMISLLPVHQYANRKRKNCLKNNFILKIII